MAVIETVYKPAENGGVQVAVMVLGVCVERHVLVPEAVPVVLRRLEREPRSAWYLMAASVLHNFGERDREREALARAALALASEIQEGGRARA